MYVGTYYYTVTVETEQQQKRTRDVYRYVVESRGFFVARSFDEK